MINIEQITRDFSKLPIEKIGITSGFIKREKKLTSTLFVMSFFSSFSGSMMCKTSVWVQTLSELIGEPITKQGFNKRIGWLCVSFCEQVLSQALIYTLSKATHWQNETQWLTSFKRVFVEDSTALKLPKLLYSIYGGGTNQKESYALARVQLRMELGTERIHNIAIRNYAENDTTFAGDIIPYLTSGDLVIRDLGYFVVSLFEKIQSQGAFFITRWHPRVKFRCIKTLKPWDLNEILANAARKGSGFIDQKVYLGLQNTFEVRFIAIKVPPEVADKRLKAALEKEKKKGFKYHQKYFEHLGWAIYITNIPIEMFNFSAIWSIYRLRWRIEIIFKAWKSHLKIIQTLEDAKYLNPCQIIVRLYLIMAWIVLCLIPAFNFFAFQIFKAEKRYVSLAKFADFYCNNFKNLVNELNWDKYIPSVRCFCLYDKRKKYRNYFENLYMINSC